MRTTCRPLLRPRWAVVAGIVLLALAPAFARQPGIRHYDLRIEPAFARKTVRVRAKIQMDNPGLAQEFSAGPVNEVVLDPNERILMKKILIKD